MQLNLKKPLVTFDLETTGLDLSRDRIVSIALTKLLPSGGKENLEIIMNPGILMNDEVIALHGITNEQVQGLPYFNFYALAIWEFLQGCDLAGFNLINFDVPMLAESFYREGIHDWPALDTHIIDVKNIFMKKEERSLIAALKFYCGKSHDNAHSAGADVAATMEVLAAQIERYEFGNEVEALAAFSKMNERVDLAGKIAKDKNGDYIYNFSQNKGTKVKDNIPFAYWILDRDFPYNTKMVLQQILQEAHPLVVMEEEDDEWEEDTWEDEEENEEDDIFEEDENTSRGYSSL